MIGNGSFQTRGLWIFPDSWVLEAVVPAYLLSGSCSNLSFKSHNGARTDWGTSGRILELRREPPEGPSWMNLPA